MLKIAFHPSYYHIIPKGHRFPMEKYELLPQQLLHEGTIEEDAFFKPEIIDRKHILAVHDEQYVNDLFGLKLDRRAQRKTGFIHDEGLILREKLIMEGTRKCCEYALVNGVSMNIAGGTHHSFTNRGEGFCLLNDQAIAAQWLLDTKQANKILIIDLDVHQGNGTAQIFQDNPNVFTFSMHGGNNYPLKKEKSDLDIPLADGIEDNEYIYLLESSLSEILKDFNPDFLFFQSGIDIIDTDKLGRLNVSIKGCKRRDEIVINLAKELNLPLVISMGGGYSKEIKHIIEAHANTYRTAQYIFF
ncbi:histone deacetylase family protein [Brumimicrobium aurantiacum]|uniref:Histone deacetylase n=1 Tax=Brumimicrobium aurantiacum TaxID=1737063 RepID=A0A3E1EV95_9FLAO|nr:histone deacetylase [Brumimicrobium aurantiacum]RFC53460.1 histone deacetylase [Brumimicrobium aurantiacum]